MQPDERLTALIREAAGFAADTLKRWATEHPDEWQKVSQFFDAGLIECRVVVDVMPRQCAALVFTDINGKEHRLAIQPALQLGVSVN